MYGALLFIVFFLSFSFFPLLFVCVYFLYDSIINNNSDVFVTDKLPCDFSEL